MLLKIYFLWTFSPKDQWLVDFPRNSSEIFGSSSCTEIDDKDFISAFENEIDLQFDYVEDNSNTDTYSSCQEAMISFLDYSNCQNTFTRCFNFTEHQNVPKESTFTAVASYQWEFWLYLNITSPAISAQDAVQKMKDICSGVVISELSSQTDCFEMLYIYSVITEGYGIEVSSRNLCRYRTTSIRATSHY